MPRQSLLFIYPSKVGELYQPDKIELNLEEDIIYPFVSILNKTKNNDYVEEGIPTAVDYAFEAMKAVIVEKFSNSERNCEDFTYLFTLMRYFNDYLYNLAYRYYINRDKINFKNTAYLIKRRSLEITREFMRLVN